MRRLRFPLIVLLLAAVFHFFPFFDGAEAWIVRGLLRGGAGLRSAALWVEGSAARVGSISALVRENGELKDKVLRLEESTSSASGLIAENESLKGMLTFRSRSDQTLVSANVIGADPDATLRALVIDRGSEEGIVRGDPVIVGDGTLVGKVERVSAGRSTVLLLTDPRSAVGVMVSDRPEANGVAQGEKGLVVVMNLIPQHAKVEKGDITVTTGRDQRIPRGLVIGRIENVTAVPSDPFMTATIVPSIDAIALSKVAVIRQK